jgi:pyruvate kinase
MNKEQIEQLIHELDQIIDRSSTIEGSFSSDIEAVDSNFIKSAKNLLHYIALRKFDIHTLQESLSSMGLSSLGRSESHVLFSLIAVRNQLALAINGPMKNGPSHCIGIKSSRENLEHNTEMLLGKSRDERSVRIMVTLPEEAAVDYAYVKNLLITGMDCARINCAHDSKEVWIRMIDNLNRAKKETGIECKILMDLAGIKLRTGKVKEGPRVIGIKTKRDYFGKLISPAKIWMSDSQQHSPKDTHVFIPVSLQWLSHIQPGDKIYFQDKRGKKRQFEIVFCDRYGCKAELYKRSYIESGTKLYLKDKKRPIEPTQVGLLRPIELPLILKNGDLLLIHKAEVAGENAKYDEKGLLIEPAHVSCSSPEIFTKVNLGEPILFNDGKIEGIISSATEDLLVVKITFAKPEGSLLGSDKGINLPQSDLGISGLTQKDLDDLHFIAHHADIVNLSFANHPKDVIYLLDEIKKLNAMHLSVMLKIETRKAVENLPLLLLAIMRKYPAGIMIARGDLAIECGWEKLAEIQEEILWLCEAAHIPVVWATQVLEGMAKKGSPSRAEITDAAMSQRADCVMLNKGPHILKAIETLRNILQRMEKHQRKKTSILRNLKLSDAFQDKV